MNEQFFEVSNDCALAVTELCGVINDWATKKGWNDDPLAGLTIPPAIRTRIELAFKAEQLALIHSETSEALEYLRQKQQPAMDDKVPELTGEEAEMADTVIRILHYCGKRDIDLGRAIKLKHKFNISRPYKHGKNC